MSKPTEAPWANMKRFVRYFCGRPRAVARFHLQEQSGAINVYSDASWAGCRASRKSTSGGAVLWGGCCIKSYGKTQNTVAETPAESELMAIVRASTEAIGLISLAEHLRI